MSNYRNCEFPHGALNTKLPFLAVDGGRKPDARGPNRYNPRGLPLSGYDPGTSALLGSMAPNQTRHEPDFTATGEIVGPSQLKAQLDKIHNYIVALNEETIRSGWADRKPAFWGSWEKFLQEWYIFRAKNYDNFWTVAATMNEGDVYQQRAEEWRKKWESYGATFNTPSLPEPPKQPTIEGVIEKAGNVSIGIGYAAIGIGVAVGAFYLFKIMKE